MSYNYQHILPQLRSKKVGLVLSGGGFKGAYQIGVWKALTDPRIGITQFHSIAGTSVGALNGFLVANGNIQDAEEVWRTPDLLKLSVKAVRSYGVAYVLFFGPFVTMALTLGAAFSMVRPIYVVGEDLINYRFFSEIFLAILLALSPLATWLLLDEPGNHRDWITLPLFFLLVMLGENISWLHFPATDPLALQAMALVSVFFVGLSAGLLHGTIDIGRPSLYFIDESIFLSLALVASAASLLPMAHLEALSKSILLFWFIVLMGSAIVGIPLGRAAAKSFDHAHQNSHLLSNDRLLNVIRNRLSLSKIKAVNSLHATLAEHRLVVNPFVPAHKPSKYDPRAMDYDMVNPRGDFGWYPNYVDLCQLDTVDDVLQVLRHTSALPFILESGVTKDGHAVVDGGIVDNIPILPVLQAQVDYVIVVQLSPLRAEGERLRDLYNKHLRATWKQWFLSKLSSERAQAIYQQWMNQWRDTGNREFWHLLPESPTIRQEQILSIAPAKALASIDRFGLRFLTGTINLSVKARSEWMAMGFDDTLKMFGVSAGTSAPSELDRQTELHKRD
jgi:predicted acylesterase/phospholipase RssA